MAAVPASAQPAGPLAPPTYEQKLAWMLRLEDQRILRDPPPPAPAAPAPPPRATGRKAGRTIAASPVVVASPDLVRLLGDGEGRVRRRAALAIGRVGLVEGVAPLAKILASDAEPEVRQMAAFALGLIGQRAAIEPLRTALGDPSPLVQGRAAEALGLVGDAASAPAVAAMAARQLAASSVATLDPDDLTDPQLPGVDAFRLGIYALARLKAYDALASVVLDAAGQPRARWWPVAYALSRTDDKRFVPALMTWLGGSGSLTRAFAARGLQTIKDGRAVAALALRAQGWQQDPRAAVAAIRALGQLGAPESATVIRGLLQTPLLDPNLRLETVAALGALGGGGSIDRLIELAADPWPSMRAAALRAMRQVDPDTFLMVLSSLDADPHWSVRAALASIVATLDPAVAVPRLTVMLGDRDARVIPAVVEALARLHPPDLGPTLLRLLKHEDVMVRAAAATAIGEMKLQGGDAALAEAYRAGLGDGMYQARTAALGALTKYGSGAVMPVLKQALGDRDWAVRVRALALARDLDPASDLSAAIRPAPGPSTDYYASPSLVSPPVSPHVFLETDKGTIEIELAVLDAPLTAANFLALARSGAFSGVAIHRVVANFVVQDGDPRGDGEGSPGYTIRDELNERPFLRGTVGMALDWADTGGSQFFITHSPQPHLDGRYTVFGHVVAGMECVDRLQQWDVIRRVKTWDGIELTVK
ncbi:MAG: HEAT repeat domain-containing protein [Acidobacteria bacterium]|nr:HEAT repeat domain-containing protein [Acidobacteriota bacterium]